MVRASNGVLRMSIPKMKKKRLKRESRRVEISTTHKLGAIPKNVTFFVCFGFDTIHFFVEPIKKVTKGIAKGEYQVLSRRLPKSFRLIGPTRGASFQLTITYSSVVTVAFIYRYPL